MFNWLKSKPQEPKTLGQIGEEIAQKEYEKKGFKIIAKNEYNKKGKRLGEIDFIARQKDSLVFVEVKTRKEDKGFFKSEEHTSERQSHGNLACRLLLDK